jgi:ABC-type uncharacterized transport system permease subunit
MNQQPPTIDARYRVLLILWFAICMSVAMLLVVALVVTTASNENQMMTVLLNSVGVLPVAISFLLKYKLLAQAAETQRLDLVQSAYVLAFALCEVAALLALFDHFVTGSRYFYVGFAIAGMGLLLHFPQKAHLANAEPNKGF